MARIRSSQTTRLALLLGVFSFVIWLACDSPPKQAIWATIAAELSRGTIGALSAEDSKLLRETVDWLAPHAGVRDSIVVNGKPQPGVLHIYTTTPDAVAVTGCARGNAVYDSRLNAIFVDKEILHPEELPLLGERGRFTMVGIKDLPFVAVYFRFVLLHELGHSRLHRRSGGFFDMRNGSRVAEEEADNFAVQKLESAYTADLAAGGRLVGKGAGEFIQMKTAEVSVPEKVWVDLVGSVSAMSTALLFSASNFSTFYSDTAHPNFIQRASAILNLAITSRASSATLKAHARYHQESLRRLQTVADSSFAEVQVPEGIQKVAFDQANLLVMTNGGMLYASSLEDIRKAMSHRGTIRLTRPLVRANLVNPEEDRTWLSAMWGSVSLGTVIVRPEVNSFSMNAFTIRNNKFVQLPALTKGIANGPYGPNVFTPPQPAEAAILSDTVGLGKEFTVVRGDVATECTTWDNIVNVIMKKTGLPSVRVEIGTVTGEIAYLSIYDTSGPRERLFGVAQLNLINNKLVSICALRFEYEGGGDAPGLIGDKLVVVPRGDDPLYILVTRNREHLQAYRLSESAQMKLLIEYPFIFNTTRGAGTTWELLAAFDPTLLDARWVPPMGIVAVFASDSVYFIEPNTSRASVIFTPGTRIQTTISAQGNVALFVANGQKVYILPHKS